SCAGFHASIPETSGRSSSSARISASPKRSKALCNDSTPTAKCARRRVCAMGAGCREMTQGEGRGSVLIVATDRDDRRVLFDALDSQEFDAIYTAKDVAQARAFLEQDPQIDLVLLEFLDDARGALAF